MPDGPSVERWLQAFRESVAEQKRIFAEHSTIEARTAYEGVGEGGDNTLVIDRLCEDTVFDQLERLAAEGHEFVAVSEERGIVAYGESPKMRVVIDPIDGSVNARRMIPAHSLSIAVAAGDSMAEVELGYVYEFGAAEEFVGVRGDGAMRDGVGFATTGGDGMELVALEAAKPERVVPVAERLSGHAYRLRSPGSIAISLSYVAAGRYDGMLTTRPCRSVDAAAGQLIAREAGARVAFEQLDLADVPLDLERRYQVAAARTEGDLAVLLEAQAAIGVAG